MFFPSCRRPHPERQNPHNPTRPGGRKKSAYLFCQAEHPLRLLQRTPSASPLQLQLEKEVGMHKATDASLPSWCQQGRRSWRKGLCLAKARMQCCNSSDTTQAAKLNRSSAHSSARGQEILCIFPRLLEAPQFTRYEGMKRRELLIGCAFSVRQGTTYLKRRNPIRSQAAFL